MAHTQRRSKRILTREKRRPRATASFDQLRESQIIIVWVGHQAEPVLICKLDKPDLLTYVTWKENIGKVNNCSGGSSKGVGIDLQTPQVTVTANKT